MSSEIVGIAAIWLGPMNIAPPATSRDEIRLSFTAGVALKVAGAMDSVGPKVTVGSSIAYDPKMTRAEIDQAIAERLLSVLQTAAAVPLDRVLAGFDEARHRPIFQPLEDLESVGG
jgi:hypothetical protein